MESLHYLLMKSHSLMQKRIFQEAQKIGLTSGQPKILDYLYDHEGSDQKTIAAYCEIEPATIANVLLRMEQKGLIERKQKDGNRRSLFVYLTDKGKECSDVMHNIFNEYDKIAASKLSDDEIEKLKSSLTEICKNLMEKSKK